MPQNPNKQTTNKKTKTFQIFVNINDFHVIDLLAELPFLNFSYNHLYTIITSRNYF